jgi:hypothetical protein
MKITFTDKEILLLTEAYDYCDENDKSVEFTLQYLQDAAKVSFDKAFDFYNSQSK